MFTEKLMGLVLVLIVLGTVVLTGKALKDANDGRVKTVVYQLHGAK